MFTKCLNYGWETLKVTSFPDVPRTLSHQYYIQKKNLKTYKGPRREAGNSHFVHTYTTFIK